MIEDSNVIVTIGRWIELDVTIGLVGVVVTADQVFLGRVVDVHAWVKSRTQSAGIALHVELLAFFGRELEVVIVAWLTDDAIDRNGDRKRFHVFNKFIVGFDFEMVGQIVEAKWQWRW